jgi:hypothetical protein
MPFSQYLADELIDWVKGTDMPTAPTTVYIALFNGDPSGAGTEITNTIKGSTTRDAIALGGVTTSGTFRQADNIADITITLSASAGATADYAAIYDAATGGNLLSYDTLTSSKTITTGDEVKFEANAAVYKVKIA